MTVSATPRVLITGFGLVTPLGHSAWETFTALLAGRTIADRVGQLSQDTAPVDLVRAAGCISVAQHISVDPAIDLAERAGREAMFMAGVTQPATQDGIVGSSKGAMHALTRVFEPSPLGRGQGEGIHDLAGSSIRTDAARIRKSPHPNPLPKGEGARVIALGPHGYLAHQLQRRLGINNLTCTVAACASGLTALHQAREQLIHASPDEPNRLLVLTSEASLLPMFIRSYDRLGVLPPLTPGDYRGRPLDNRRHGFMLAEVGAAIVLERRDLPETPGSTLQSEIRNQKSEITLLDTAIAAEAYHLIRPNPAMPALAHAARRLCNGRAIDAIHPHATGTADHDPAELNIYSDLQLATRNPQPATPCIYANKGALGHTLGASGLVSLVIACLCARTRRLPPMPWLTQPIDSSFRLTAESQTLPPRSTHAVFAAGFGGHVAGAVIAI